MKTAKLDSRSKGPRRSTSQITVLHVPHSSQRVPAEERQTILLDDAALNNELLRMTDAYTEELFPITPVEAGRVIFHLSRLVCDVERFPSDENEPMAARGMGVTYTRTSMGEVLRVQPDAPYREIILDRWYWPHHSALEGLANDVAARAGVCLIGQRGASPLDTQGGRSYGAGGGGHGTFIVHTNRWRLPRGPSQ